MLWFKHKRSPMFWILMISSLDGLGGSLLSIFLPIYFLTIGYSVAQVLVYFIAVSLFTFLFFIVAAALASFFNLQTVMFLRIIPLAIYLYIFYVLQFSGYSLIFLAFFVGMQSAFYWFCLHFMFAKFSAQWKIDSNVGKLFAWPKLVALVAPLIGGIILAVLNFQALLIVALVIYVVAAAMVFWLKDLEVTVDLNFGRLWQMFKKYKIFFWSGVLDNISGENGALIFPIVVFLSQKNYVKLGLLGTLVAVGGAIFPYIAGHLSEKFGRKKMFFLGSVALAVVWLLAYVAKTDIAYYSVSFTYGMLASLVVVPFTGWFYHLTKQNKIEDFLIFNEIASLVGRMILYGLALLLILHLTYIFLVAAVAYVLFYFLSRRIVV